MPMMKYIENSTTNFINSTIESMLNDTWMNNTTTIGMNITNNTTIMNETSNNTTVVYHQENLSTITPYPTFNIISKETTKVDIDSWSSSSSPLSSTPQISRIEDSESRHVYRSFSAPVDITHTNSG
ncbi:hypothetical protein Smp_192610 [Schistosoma mansoni]|uniref:Uncharacterized protein n=1 Tax=Schistosoma mansoni TaxID=6183 RepID=G4LZI8_SCHMA|nr:hypothetical protein Smp_192610 [Schistosoma mansoni]|eukprot:XP_018646656.1 hypothetical protein Smp_192610 [Schistosoma mansoni]